KTIATITVNAQSTAMRAVAAPLPGLGASSSRSQSTSLRHGETSSASRSMLHPDRHRGSDPRELPRRIVEPDPNGKALCDDTPAQRAADDRQTWSIAIFGLHARPNALDVAADGSIVGAHDPHRRLVADRNPRQFGLAKIRNRVPGVVFD